MIVELVIRKTPGDPIKLALLIPPPLPPAELEEMVEFAMNIVPKFMIPPPMSLARLL